MPELQEPVCCSGNAEIPASCIVALTSASNSEKVQSMPSYKLTTLHTVELRCRLANISNVSQLQAGRENGALGSSLGL